MPVLEPTSIHIKAEEPKQLNLIEDKVETTKSIIVKTEKSMTYVVTSSVKLL